MIIFVAVMFVAAGIALKLRTIQPRNRPRAAGHGLPPRPFGSPGVRPVNGHRATGGPIGWPSARPAVRPDPESAPPRTLPSPNAWTALDDLQLIRLLKESS